MFIDQTFWKQQRVVKFHSLLLLQNYYVNKNILIFRSFSLPLLAILLQPSLMMLAKGKEKTFLGSFHSMQETDMIIMLTMETIMEIIILSNKEIMDLVVALLVIFCF